MLKSLLTDERVVELKKQIAEKALQLDVATYPLPPMGLDQQRLWALGGKARAYSTDYCAMVVAHMAEGFSLESFAGAICTSKATIDDWVSRFPEFQYAVEVGKAAQVFAHEKIGMAIMRTGKGSADIFKFVMKNQHKWRDKIELTGADGGAIKTEATGNVSWSDQAEAKLAELLEKAGRLTQIDKETKNQLAAL